MAERPKKNSGPDTSRLTNLVKSNVANNEKTVRTQVLQYKSNAYHEQKANYTENDKSAPKPLLDCLEPGSLLISKPYEKSNSQRRRRNKPFDQKNLERSNDDQVDQPEISPGKIEIGRSTIDIRQPTLEHFSALKNAFEKILAERSLSANSLKQRYLVFTKLQQVITAARADCQVILYGSVYFDCCLEKPGSMDIDVQFKETSQYDVLKELLEIIKKSDLFKEACIDTESKPSCINFITNEPNMRVKLTSGYHRGIHLSKLFRIYTKFDPRVLKLLRLFRILAKTCNIDKPELGTLHPTVFHVMLIHFLQQVNPAVLPCLHEYAYGVDHVPITLNDNQYSDFLAVCEQYSDQWKSANETSIEMLFLQLLSYYVKTFNTKQFVVSIQTRMPVMKIDKNWHSRKLLVEDPTDVKRSLCQTMQSMRSIDYFRDTLNAALNYFGRKQKKRKTNISNTRTTDNIDDDLIEIVHNDENEVPIQEHSNLLHNSYTLFYKQFPVAVARDATIKQARVRDYYRRTFNNKSNPLPKGILQLNSSKTKFDELNENEIQEALQHDLENDLQITDDDCNDNHLHLLETIESNDQQNEAENGELFPTNEDEEQQQQSDESEIPTITNDLEQADVINEIVKENVIVSLSSTEKELTNDTHIPVESEQLEIKTIEPLPSSLVDVEINRTTIDNVNGQTPSSIKLEEIIDNEPTVVEKEVSTDVSSDYFYDFQQEHFHAEQGAPYVCTTCNGIGHLKAECPELIVPNMIPLPAIDDKWLVILSKLCGQITHRCKPGKSDIDNRERILTQLEKQFQRDCPDCCLRAFGSFYNGFGFRQSDLDVCLVFKDEREQNSEEVIRILQKILRAMRSSNTFEDVQPVLHAKVPIIRSKHRELNIEIDISLHNMLAIENTNLLKTYTEIDLCVSELGYMIKHLAKFCGIGDASRGTLSSYAYIIMLIHFLQQIQPPVLPVLQQWCDDPMKKTSMYKKCSKWNVYFYADLPKIKQRWKNENKLSTGALWIEFLRFYTEQFNYEDHVVTIRQSEPLLKEEKGWFRQTIAIEDPFELSHNLAGGLSLRNWTIIRRVFIRARQQFGVQHQDIDITEPDMRSIEEILFNIDDLCPINAPKRCTWCHGPYHLRKRCPALATLAYEKQQKKRITNNADQQWNMNNSFTPMFNYYQNDSRWHSNQTYTQNYDNNYHGRTHPRSTPPYHPPFRYGRQGTPRGFSNRTYRPNEQQINNSHRFNSTTSCYHCKDYGHIKAHCPFLKNNHSVQQQKASS